MLVDSKAVEKLVELRKKDKGLFNKLKQFITEFFNKITSRYKNLKPTSEEAKYVQQIEGMSEKLQRLFEDALLDASENHRVVGAEKITAQGGVKMQLREMGLDEFSKQTKNNIKMRNGVLVETMSELKQHIHLALTTDIKSNLYFGAIADDVKSKIEKDVNSSVFQKKQYSFVISNDDIIHISKHFGTNPDVVAKEVIRLYDIVKDYDDVKLEITKQGTKKLIFEKSYSDYDYRSIEIASNKKATLDLVTFYITKNNIKRKGNQSVPPATQNSSSQWGSVPSNNSISNDSEDVNTKFQLKQKDVDYMTAVDRGDMVTAQALVDEAARRAGYNSPMLYHGTKNFGFTEFDLTKMDDGRSIFLTSNNDIASTYSSVKGNKRVSGISGKDINTMTYSEIVEELNHFVAEHPDEYGSNEYKYEYYDYNKLIELNSWVRKEKVNLAALVDEKIVEFTEKIKEDSSEKTQKVYNQLLILKNKLVTITRTDLSSSIYMLLHHTDVFSDNYNYVAELEKKIRLVNALIENEETENGVVVEEALGGYSISVMSMDKAKNKLKEYRGTGNYALYAKMEFPLVIDGKGQRWNALKNWSNSVKLDMENTRVEIRDGTYSLLSLDTNKFVEDVDINEATSKMSKENLHNFLLNKAKLRISILTENISTTRGISKYAKDNGYDTIVFKDILDNGGRNINVERDKLADVYVVFDPNNVKSADPIVYDDNGNVIPLSERFNDAKTDIRYHKKVDSNSKLTDNKNIKNGGAVNGSQNTELLEQGAVSALGRGYDSVWQQSESARKILGYLGLVRERQTQNATDIGASDSRWLAPNAYKQQIDKGFEDGILRALRGVSLSGKDVIGRELNNQTFDRLKNTILKDEEGNVLSLYHWTQNTFDKFEFGDIGFHFGTVESAHDRYKMLKEEGIATSVGVYKEAYLNVTNPIFMPDLDQWTAYDLAFYLETQGLISELQYDRLAMTTGFYELSYDNPAINAVRKILSDLGYDGVLYYNDTEDTTSVSAIALYPEQVVMVTDNGKPVKNSIASETQNGLPRGVLNFQLKSYAAETDGELLAQHLEENSEAVGEILRRSSDIEMNERTMTRLVSKRLRGYGIHDTVLSETSENIALLLEVAKHPSVQGKDVTADLTDAIKSALESTSYDFNPNKEDYDEVVQILKDYGNDRVYLTAYQEAYVREQGYDMRWLRNRYFGKLNVVKGSKYSESARRLLC